MKKILFGGVFSLLLIAAVWFSVYAINDGGFNKWSHTTVLDEHFDNGKRVYLGYDFTWEGIGRPRITQLDFIKKDGTHLTGFEASRIQPYLEMSLDGNTIGAVDEESVIDDGKLDHLIPLGNTRVDGDFRIILRVDYDGVRIDDDIGEMIITYTKFGVIRHQAIPFDGILMDDSENDE